MGLFGPSKEEVWQQLCQEIGAEFVEGGFWKGNKVELDVGEMTITLDVYSVHANNATHYYTRMRAPYINRDGFRFKVYRNNGFAFMRRLFGVPDIELGFVEFDEKYVIQGTDTGKLTALFASATLREQLTADPSVWLEIKDDEGWFATKFPEGVDELYFSVGGIVKDIERLKGFFSVFTETLQQLQKIGSLEKGDPGVVLQ
ncbi:hypothetical protein [Armatimonas sp.]|uniref:hypothetical protein n=1 Tax=Armatimonas sp. TaxID=1872638 RepID=UPI00286C811D|nr:hypothetical protein [Armatimonas sp.]